MRQILAMVFFGWVGFAQAETFVVNAVSDTPSNGRCGAVCTFADALHEADDNGPSIDIIKFDLPAGSIRTIKSGQSISSGVVIDGFSQLGSQPNSSENSFNAIHRIRWESFAGSTILINAQNVSIRGLVLAAGIRTNANSSGLSILGCQFLQPLDVKAANVRIGSNSLADRNAFISNGFIDVDIIDNPVESGLVIMNNIFSGPNLSTPRQIVLNDVRRAQIGGTGTNEGNIFFGSPNPAINFELDSVNLAVVMRGNRFEGHSGTAGAIDLKTSANDVDDLDDGPNAQSNYAELISAELEPSGGMMPPRIRVTGRLDRLAVGGQRTYHIDLYASATCHSSGFGEGNALFSTLDFVSQGPADETFSLFTQPILLPPGTIITNLTTHADIATSEFSNCITLLGDNLFKSGFE